MYIAHVISSKFKVQSNCLMCTLCFTLLLISCDLSCDLTIRSHDQSCCMLPASVMLYCTLASCNSPRETGMQLFRSPQGNAGKFLNDPRCYGKQSLVSCSNDSQLTISKCDRTFLLYHKSILTIIVKLILNIFPVPMVDIDGDAELTTCNVQSLTNLLPANQVHGLQQLIPVIAS